MTAMRLLILQALLLSLGKSQDNAQAELGKNIFARRCSGCHAADINKEGPRLRDVYGRKSASVPDFIYSQSLRKLDFRWDDTKLDRWLTDPEAIAPDTDMAFRLDSAEERRSVIAYLKSLSNH